MMMHSSDTTQIANLLKLRLAVAALGEKAQWWPSRICDPLRINVFKQLFPKTWRLAVFSAVSDAAKIVHRESLAVRAQHLFRFQTEIEQDLRRFLNKDGGKAAFDEVMASPEAPLAILTELAQKGVRFHSGAVELGEASPECIYGSIEKMASLYLAAYRNKTRTFPYFLPQEEV